MKLSRSERGTNGSVIHGLKKSGRGRASGTRICREETPPIPAPTSLGTTRVARRRGSPRVGNAAATLGRRAGRRRRDGRAAVREGARCERGRILAAERDDRVGGLVPLGRGAAGPRGRVARALLRVRAGHGARAADGLRAVEGRREERFGQCLTEDLVLGDFGAARITYQRRSASEGFRSASSLSVTDSGRICGGKGRVGGGSGTLRVQPRSVANHRGRQVGPDSFIKRRHSQAIEPQPAVALRARGGAPARPG